MSNRNSLVMTLVMFLVAAPVINHRAPASRAQSTPENRIEKEIAVKAEELRLGPALSDVRRSKTVAVPSVEVWGQEFQRGHVYWTALARACGVYGDILARFVAEGGVGGPLGYPMADEMSAAGSPDRSQRFTGGTIYWRAATRETTVTHTVQAAPNYTAAPAKVVEATPNTATVAPVQYTVPGHAGGKWIDTGLDVRAGAMVHLFADGEVNYGANVGRHGPAGVAASGVSGLPAESISRYGLVACLTSSRTNPEDDLRHDYAFGEQKEFCSRSEGRLWLTVNDNQPEDNKGQYIVEVKLGTCAPDPASQPTPDSGRGTFRVKIVGFRVEQVVHDGLLDAGDDAYLMWDAEEFNADGRRVNNSSGQSLVYGDMGRNRAQVQAGTQGDNGGLKGGDEIKGRSTASSLNRLPMLVGDFELVAGANAIVFSPTIWVANDEAGDYPHRYRQRFQTRVRFLSYDVREELAGNFQWLHWRNSLSRGPDDWFAMLISGNYYVRRRDRPIGVSYLVEIGGQNIDGSPSTLVMDFMPHTFLLTHKSVNDLFRERGQSGQREVRFEAQYRDAGPHGTYTILMTIERLR